MSTCFSFEFFSTIVCWLMPNLLRDACHFGCITKLEKKKREKVPMDYGHSGAAYKKFLWKHCYSHNKMSQAECFWGCKISPKWGKIKEVYFVTRFSVFEKVSPNFQKKKQLKRVFHHMWTLILSLVAFFF